MNQVGHLSPTAVPFHPLYEPVHLMIFNDGIPSLTYVSEVDRFNALHGIQDDAIDEGFPPTAQEAAELEDTDAYVYLMARLDMMEECEERARAFTHGPKRWEVRRRRGLLGRPRPAMHLVTPASHGPALSGSRSLVASTHRQVMIRGRRQSKGLERLSMPRAAKRGMVRVASIQQPRKQN
jgi:hypothetical protein